MLLYKGFLCVVFFRISPLSTPNDLFSWFCDDGARQFDGACAGIRHSLDAFDDADAETTT